MSVSKSHEYRADIDGLRALAILSVVFFHLRFTGFEGGFIGVDIFFVISGYLITRIIYKQKTEGNFSFRSFYARRARRLLPALLFTMAATLFAGFFILSPNHYEQMNGSLLYGLFSISNFFFIGVSGYFDISSQFQPLLHTWSLGVEEQFYIIWPVILLISMTVKQKAMRIGIFIAIVIAALLSIILASLFADSKSSFYFTPFRIYEFFIGITLVFIPQLRGPNWVKEITFVLGMALIIAAILLFDVGMKFPSYVALIPTIGAALIIHSNNPRISGRLLSNRLLVGVGLISYSLYLVHWPIFVYFNYLTIGYSAYTNIIVLVLSLITSVGMYYCIEQPFRKQKRHILYKKATPIICITFICLILVSLHGYKTGGWAWRFSDRQMASLKSEMEANTELSNAHYEHHNMLPEGIEINGNKNILVVGDSHSRDVFNALSTNRKSLSGYNIFHMYLDEKCFPRHNYQPTLARKLLGIDTHSISEGCEAGKEAVRQSAFVQKANIVIIANATSDDQSDDEMDRLPNIIAFYRAHAKNAEITLFGMNRLPFDPPTFYMLKNGSPSINKQMYSLDRPNHEHTNALLEHAANKEKINYFNFYSILCRDDKKECSVLDENKTLLYDDDNHWTFAGELYFGKKLLQAGLIN